jgi:hypothetical protein
MDKIPFSVYDFFAYLSSGTVVLTTIDYVYKLGILQQKEVSILFGIALVVAAYVCGQLVAHFSALLLEHVLVSKVLKRPTVILMHDKKFAWIRRCLFPGYHRSLPSETQFRVRKQAESRDVSPNDETLFLHAYAIVTANEKWQARLDDFRNQYGFARNMCLAFFISAIMLTTSRLLGDATVKWGYVAVVFGVAMTLLYRYLKFFRQFSYELLIRYAELQKPKTAAVAGV